MGSVERVKHFVAEYHIRTELRFLSPESTRTSLLASESIGCTVAEIAKTIGFLHFVTPTQVRPVLVTLSGDRQVSLEKLARYLETEPSTLRKMTADEVRTFTGYSIGGVPPFSSQ
jgi:prolyl-tRNA editing enzyme YbaK/EbsC (Cys-tRNA(Pro) deacylase)